MSIEAALVQYRQDFIPAFEQKVSMLATAGTKQIQGSGNQAVFLVSGNAADTAVTRGTNGQIPYSNPTNNQTTVTLVEKHAPYELTGFNVFASQGNQIQIMRNESIAVINRDIDLVMLAELANCTQHYGSGTASLNTILGAQAILGQNDVNVDEEDNMFGVISPAFRAYLMQTTEFASADYVDTKAFGQPVRPYIRWAGINWIVSNRITGIGTSNELCYLFHRGAIGYAVNSGDMKVAAGYDEKQDISWSRASIYHGAKILQNSGIVQMVHDGSAYVAS